MWKATRANITHNKHSMSTFTCFRCGAVGHKQRHCDAVPLSGWDDIDLVLPPKKSRRAPRRHRRRRAQACENSVASSDVTVSLDDTEDTEDFDYDDVCGISACPYYQTFFASQRGAPYLRGVISLPPVDHGTSLRLQPLLHKNGSGPDWVFAVAEAWDETLPEVLSIFGGDDVPDELSGEDFTRAMCSKDHCDQWHVREPGCLNWVVIEGCGSSEELVGCLVAQASRDTPGEWELGYFVRRSKQRRGYATRAAAAAVGWFREQMKATRVLIECDEQNAASNGVVLKLLETTEAEQVPTTPGSHKYAF